MMTDQHTLKFSVNNWQHLYSLKDAIRNAEEVSGKTLTISGTVRNDDLLAEHDTKIAIQFHQIAHFPQYATTTNNEIILGQLSHTDAGLTTHIDVTDIIFEELKKNLIEYADIDGIHIIVSCSVLIHSKPWNGSASLDIISLDYAMKGDA